MDNRDVATLVLRYGILLILPLFDFALFYFLFTPLTVEPVFALTKLFYPEAVLLGSSTIFFQGEYAQIIPACIAGAAYYLLLILNLTTPMRAAQRVKSLLFLILSFLVLNILRILFFMYWFASGFNYFDIAHQAAWYFGSTVMIVIVWFANVLLFRIQAIPVYTDIAEIVKDLRHAPASSPPQAQRS